MQENETTEDAATETTEGSETTGDASEEKELTLDDIDKTYFKPEELVNASEEIAKIMQIPVIAKGTVKALRNFKEDEELPENYGMWILPISKTIKIDGEGKRKAVGVVFAGVPDLSAVGEHEKGEAFVREVVSEYFAAKVSNSVRPRGDSAKVTGIMPCKIEEFLENRKTHGSMKTFNELADDYVTFLKEKGLKRVTKPILRQILQSKLFAESIYSKMEADGKWLDLLDHMVKTAEARKLDTAVFDDWRENRDEYETDEEDDIDMDDMSLLFSDEDEEDAETETADDKSAETAEETAVYDALEKETATEVEETEETTQPI